MKLKSFLAFAFTVTLAVSLEAAAAEETVCVRWAVTMDEAAMGKADVFKTLKTIGSSSSLIVMKIEPLGENTMMIVESFGTRSADSDESNQNAMASVGQIQGVSQFCDHFQPAIGRLSGSN